MWAMGKTLENQADILKLTQLLSTKNMHYPVNIIEYAEIMHFFTYISLIIH